MKNKVSTLTNWLPCAPIANNTGSTSTLKPTTAALLLLAWLSSVSSVAIAADDYRVSPGERWTNINIGGEPVRTRSSICHQQRCFLIDDIDTPVNALMKQYQLSTFSYNHITPIATQVLDDETLILPEDIGKLIFDRAYLQDIKERRKERFERFRD